MSNSINSVWPPTIFGTPSVFGQSTNSTSNLSVFGSQLGGSKTVGTSNYQSGTKFGPNICSGATATTVFGGSSAPFSASSGQSFSFGVRINGSRKVAYTATNHIEEHDKKVQPLSAMPDYQGKSHEELRLEDYNAEDKGQVSKFPLPPQGQSSTSQIPSSQISTNPFPTSTNPFLPPTSNKPFPTRTNAFPPLTSTNPFPTPTNVFPPLTSNNPFSTPTNVVPPLTSTNPFPTPTNAFPPLTSTNPFPTTNAFPPLASTNPVSTYNNPFPPNPFAPPTASNPTTPPTSTNPFLPKTSSSPFPTFTNPSPPPTSTNLFPPSTSTNPFPTFTNPFPTSTNAFPPSTSTNPFPTPTNAFPPLTSTKSFPTTNAFPPLASTNPVSTFNNSFAPNPFAPPTASNPTTPPTSTNLFLPKTSSSPFPTFTNPSPPPTSTNLFPPSTSTNPFPTFTNPFPTSTNAFPPSTSTNPFPTCTNPSPPNLFAPPISPNPFAPTTPPRSTNPLPPQTSTNPFPTITNSFPPPTSTNPFPTSPNPFQPPTATNPFQPSTATSPFLPPSFTSPAQPPTSTTPYFPQKPDNSFANVGAKIPSLSTPWPSAPEVQTTNLQSSSKVIGQITSSQGPAVESTVDQPLINANPFGRLPEMAHLSVKQLSSNVSVQYGISSMPVHDKLSNPVRLSPMLTSRHLSHQRIRLPVRNYDSKSERPKVPFFNKDEERPSLRTTTLVPRENPRAFVLSAELRPHKSGTEEMSSGTNVSLHENDEGVKSEKNTEEPSTVLNVILSAHEPDLAQTKMSKEKFKALMPQLSLPDYYTESSIKQLAEMEKAEPGYCGRVNNFEIGRYGFGNIKFIGDTDVRNLSLDSLVEFNNREVVVYKNEDEKPSMGEGLNKEAVVTLLNINCVDKKTGAKYVEGPKVEKYKEMLIKKGKEQGVEFISYDPAKGEWKFKVPHF